MTASPSIVKLEVALSSWTVVAPCLTVNPFPEGSLVTEPSVYTVRSCADCFACWPFSTLPAFPGFLAGVCGGDAGIGVGTFPTSWFA